MNEVDSSQDMLLLRRVTRAISQQLEAELREHLATLGGLLQPRLVYGSYVRGGPKDPTLAAERAFKSLRESYESAMAGSSFRPTGGLVVPIEAPHLPLEVAPFAYDYVATAGGIEKTIAVVRPLVWTLSFGSGGVPRLRTLLGERRPEPAAIQALLLDAHVLAGTLAHRPGVTKILEELRFPVHVERDPELANMPVIRVTAPIPTHRPADDVLIESTEISGGQTFEEVIDVAGVSALTDPLRDRLEETLRKHGVDAGGLCGA